MKLQTRRQSEKIDKKSESICKKRTKICFDPETIPSSVWKYSRYWDSDDQSRRRVTRSISSPWTEGQVKTVQKPTKLQIGQQSTCLLRLLDQESMGPCAFAIQLGARSIQLQVAPVVGSRYFRGCLPLNGVKRVFEELPEAPSLQTSRPAGL